MQSNDQWALHYAIRGESNNYKAYTNGKITLLEDGVCIWDPNIDRKQGHIQKNREDDLIAAEIDELMIAKIPDFDTTPPTAPKNISHSKKDSKLTLYWDASLEDTKGSWVVAYNIYLEDELVGQAYGTKYTGDYTKKGKKKFEIRAINASGTLSKPSTYIVK